jgi:hypothetical protein|nr:MAG TPA: hypothetical protein [Caudoviricetes sp.]
MAARYGNENGNTTNNVDVGNIVNNLTGNTTNNMQQSTFSTDVFSNLAPGLINQGGVSTNLAELKKKAEEILAAKNQTTQVLVLDKDVLTELAYSYIVFFQREGKTNRVRYVINCLASSGRKSLTAKETLRIAEIAKTDKGYGADELYTYADTIDTFLHGITMDQIAATLKDLAGTKIDWIAIDGLVIPYHLDPMQVIEQVTITSASSINMDYETSLGKGLNLATLKSLIKTGVFKYSIETHKEGYIKDRLNNPIKADFTATIEIKDTNKSQQLKTVHKVSIDKKLVQASGYITGYPIYRGQRLDPMGRQLPEWEIAPNIIITNIRSFIPDTASSLLGIIAGALVGAQKQYVKVVMDTMTEDRHPGWYNLLTHEVNTGTKTPKFEPINVLDTSYQPADRAIVIDKLFSYGSPIITLDVTAFGESAAALSPFVWSDTEQAAREEIIAAAKILTNAQDNTDGTNAFTNVPIHFAKNLIVAGSYATKKEERDIRDLEFEKLLSLTKLEDPTAMNMYFGSIATNKPDSFNEKTELLANYIPDASMDGKTIRITLHPAFIKALIAGVQGAGLITQVDNSFAMPTTGFNTDQLSTMGAYNLDQGFGQNIIYNVNPTIGANGQINYNSYKLYY